MLVKEGQDIAENEPMLEVETDKAAVEIPSPVAGKVSEINVEAGQTVHVGDVMLVIDDGSAGGNGQAATRSQPAQAKA